MTADSKYATLHWHEYAPQVVQAYNLKPTGKDRYNGPCPSCGGTDRFWINNHNGELRVNCNQCGDWKEVYSRMQSDGIVPQPNQSSSAGGAPVSNLSDFDEVVPYFMRKGVPQGNAKVVGTDTLVPIYKISGGKLKLVGKQTISAEGKKLFDRGMSQEAAFSPVGGKPDGVTYICEGWATASSVSACTGRPAIFALNSGNLPKAAAVLSEAFPDVSFIVAADNDEAGIKSAEATGLLYRAPSRAGADWNDIHVQEGALSVKTQLGKIKKPKTGCDVCSRCLMEGCGKGHEHKTVMLQLDDDEIPIDEEIAEMIQLVWDLDMMTSMSCQDNIPTGFICIEFPCHDCYSR